MGSFKRKLGEGVKEVRENQKETTDIGSEMNEEAEKINAYLESIELQDEEDIKALSDTGRSYQKSFDGAFKEQVESAGKEIEQQGDQIRDTTESELENVRSGISKLERAEGISEIGREAAEGGRSNLEKSAGEYEGIISDAEGVVDETKKQIEIEKNNLSKIFG